MMESKRDLDPKTSTTYRGLPPSLRTPSFGLGNPASRYAPTTTVLHSHEDPLILEIGSRILRAGYANEAAPRCRLAWSEVMWRRSGERVPTMTVGKRQGGSSVWDLGFVLHGEDGEDADARQRRQMGLVEDQVERGLRIAYNKHLLLDSKTRRVLLPVPPLFPTKLLTAILATLFVHFQPPTITLMSAPVLATIAAGLRSALVVDIGWEETVVTPVYELRAIEGRGLGVHGRCRRGIKVLREQWAGFLSSFLRPGVLPDLDEVEEIMERLGYIPSLTAAVDGAKEMMVPLNGHSLRIPFKDLAIPAEKTFFAPSTTPSDTPNVADDDDTPLPLLLYHALLRSPIDVRAACIPRIVFVGGGSRIPGLQSRVLKDLQGIIEDRGWVLGLRGANAVLKRRKVPTTRVESFSFAEEDEDKENQHGGKEKKKPAREGDSKKGNEKGAEVRGIKSLGVWCGGSLVAGLKVKGKMEVERDRFLSLVAMGGTGLQSTW